MQLSKKTFNEWYSKLPADEQADYRGKIMEKLEIGRAMFYHIKNGLRKISQAEKDAINAIAEMELIYPGDDDVTADLNLVKQ